MIRAVVLCGLLAGFGYAAGVRAGRRLERAESDRRIHDTVLQALEAMALVRPSDSVAPEVRLAELRAMARAQATALRLGLDRAAGDRLGTDLAGVVADLARDGLCAELLLADIDDTLPAARRDAVRGATREALRNTLKHADTNRAVVRVEERDRGIVVVARDHGSGFDPARQPPGFGIRESIMARMASVGGHADVTSSPGGGTRVTLWVPR
jgi:signal transduction histidine kinase